MVRGQLLLVAAMLQLLAGQSIERETTCRISELRQRQVIEGLNCRLRFQNSTLVAAKVQDTARSIAGRWELGDQGVALHPLWRQCLSIVHRSGKEVSLCPEESLRDLNV